MTDIISNDNLLTPTFILESVKQFIMSQENILGGTFIPIKETTKKLLKIKITKNKAKPTKPVARGAASNLKDIEGSNYITYKPLDFRDKFPLVEDHYLAMLEYQEGFKNVTPGTAEFDSLQAKGAELLEEIVREIGLGVISSVEKGRWDMLSGTVTFANLGVTLDYNFDAGRKPTAGVLWTNTSTAIPVENIRAWKRLFKGSGFIADKIYMNQVTYDLFVATDEVKGYMSGTDSSVLLLLEGDVDRVLKLPIIIYNECYIDDSGDPATYIPDNRVIIVGRPTVGNQSIAQFMSTPSEYNGLRPGLFSRLTHDEAGDPPSFLVVAGYVGLPTLNFDDGDAIVYATV